MKRKFFIIPTLAVFALLGAPAQAAIVVLNEFSDQLSDRGNPPEQDFENVPYTIQFDAGATATKLILTLSSEGGNTAAITYGGNSLTPIPNTALSRNRGVWYLDLAGTGYAGGDASLTFDLTANGTVNGIGFGVVSISGSAPGFAASNVSAVDSTSVSVTVPAADSFVVTNYAANGGANVTAPTGHTLLYTGDIGSAEGGASYLNGVAAGSPTYTWGGTVPLADDAVTSAAVFVIPEPSTAALIGLCGLFLLRRRR